MAGLCDLEDWRLRGPQIGFPWSFAELDNQRDSVASSGHLLVCSVVLFACSSGCLPSLYALDVRSCNWVFRVLTERSPLHVLRFNICVSPSSSSVSFHIVGHRPMLLGLGFSLPPVLSVVANRAQHHMVKTGLPLGHLKQGGRAGHFHGRRACGHHSCTNRRVGHHLVMSAWAVAIHSHPNLSNLRWSVWCHGLPVGLGLCSAWVCGPKLILLIARSSQIAMVAWLEQTHDFPSKSLIFHHCLSSLGTLREWGTTLGSQSHKNSTVPWEEACCSGCWSTTGLLLWASVTLALPEPEGYFCIFSLDSIGLDSGT